MMIKENFITSVCREPYRVFFPLGVLFGIIGVGHWHFYAIGWLSGYSGFYHSSIQMQVYMSCFVIGFLLTAMPRMTSSPSATLTEFILFFTLTVGIFLFLTFDYAVFSEICFIGLLVSLALFGRRRFLLRKNVNPPAEFIWVPIGILCGILGNALLILGQLQLASGLMMKVGERLMTQGFILAVVIGVGGFLAPRLTGRFRVSRQQEAACIGDIPKPVLKKIVVYLVAGAFFVGTFWMEGFGKTSLAYGLRALLATGLFFWTGALPLPPKVKDFYAWLVWVSFWMVAAGLWGTAFFPDYKIALLHLMFIGGFSLMTFSIATMVTLSHAGQSTELRKPLLILWVIAFGIMAAVFFRIFAVYRPVEYFELLNFGAMIWMFAGMAWLAFAIPKILHVPSPADIEKQHQLAKERMLKMSAKGADNTNNEKN